MPLMVKDSVQMSVKSLMYLTSALASAGIIINPLAAQAGGMSQLETWGRPNLVNGGHAISNLTCEGPGFNNIRQMNVPRTPGVGSGPSAFRSNVPGVGTTPAVNGFVT